MKIENFLLKFWNCLNCKMLFCFRFIELEIWTEKRFAVNLNRIAKQASFDLNFHIKTSKTFLNCQLISIKWVEMKVLVLVALVACLASVHCQFDAHGVPSKFWKVSQKKARQVCDFQGRCLLPKYTSDGNGNCAANKLRYRYDAVAQKCVEFPYSGCNGTENRFKSMKECAKACHTSNHVSAAGEISEHFDSWGKL